MSARFVLSGAAQTGTFRPRSVLWRLGVTVLVATCFHVAPVSGQVVAVHLDVSENTGGLLQSAFGAALRGLHDVSVGSSPGWQHRRGPTGIPEFHLAVTVLCFPADCQRAQSYVTFVTLAEVMKPITPWQTFMIAERAVPSATTDSLVSFLTWAWLTLSDSVGFRLRELGYVRPVAQWTAVWPRGAYEQGVGELVATIDARVFERWRSGGRPVR